MSLLFNHRQEPVQESSEFTDQEYLAEGGEMERLDPSIEALAIHDDVFLVLIKFSQIIIRTNNNWIRISTLINDFRLINRYLVIPLSY